MQPVSTTGLLLLWRDAAGIVISDVVTCVLTGVASISSAGYASSSG